MNLEEKMRKRAKELFKKSVFTEEAWNDISNMPFSNNPAIIEAERIALEREGRIRKIG